MNFSNKINDKNHRTVMRCLHLYHNIPSSFASFCSKSDLDIRSTQIVPKKKERIDELEN
jgi:hypothetical protein